MTTELGRFAGKVLAELGADVLRVQPGEPGPDLTPLPGPVGDGLGLLDHWHDSGCRIGLLDLDQPADIARFEALVGRCDIVIDGRAPSEMEGRGLGPSDLAALNPRLVHVSLTPQGMEGPRAGWRSSDLVAQSLGGYLSVTGDPDRPVALWGRQAATVGGFYAAISALAGLNRARLTGRGSWVDLSLHEAIISCSEHLLMYWWFADALAALGAPIAGRQRSLHWIRAFEVVPCARGACMVSPAAGGLLDLIAWLKKRGHARDVPDVPDDDELLSLVAPLMQALKDVALESDATELFEAGQSLHVPFGEAFSVQQVAECVQHRARGFFRPVQPPGSEANDSIDGAEPQQQAPPVESVDQPATRGGILLPGPLARLSATPAPDPRPPQPVRIDDVIAAWEPVADIGIPDGDSGAANGGTQRADDRPLAGLRVLDFTHVLAGPFATRVLADLGADVIRVQTEERTSATAANDFPYNVLWARSKRSVQLHMKHPESIVLLQRLVEQADVVVDNFSAGVMAGWGAGPDQLARWNPRLISMSMSGCGADGPWQEYVTYAPTVHALCGLTALTGPPGEADCGPGIAYNDHLSGLAGAMALLAAVEHRQHSGRGQHIDLSQLEVGTYLVGPAVVDYLATGRVHRANGNVDPFTPKVVNDVYLAADGEWLAVTITDSDDWAKAASLFSPDADPPAALARWVAERPAGKAQDRLQDLGLAAGLVQNASHLVNDDRQLAHRDWLVTMDSPMIGRQTTERHPGRWYDGDRELTLTYGPSPYLGEHNFEVYEELLGWDVEKVAAAIGDDLVS